jgi:beta-glucosidase
MKNRLGITGALALAAVCAGARQGYAQRTVAQHRQMEQQQAHARADLAAMPWMNTSLSPDQRADLVLKQMTLDEKISLLHGNGMAHGT